MEGPTPLGFIRSAKTLAWLHLRLWSWRKTDNLPDNGRRLLLIAEHYALHWLIDLCDSAGDGLAVNLLALVRNSDSLRVYTSLIGFCFKFLTVLWAHKKLMQVKCANKYSSFSLPCWCLSRLFVVHYFSLYTLPHFLLCLSLPWF